MKTIAEPIYVTVDYDDQQALAKAIQAARVDNVFTGLPLTSVPLIGSGRKVQAVYEVHFDSVMYNGILPEALKTSGESLGFKGGLKFADPLTALIYAGAHRDRIRQYPLAVLLTIHGQLWGLYLFELIGQYNLDFFQRDSNGGWPKDVRFLAVHDLPLPVRPQSSS
jgi:hypothetical protein